jgi:hypothetical protein
VRAQRAIFGMHVGKILAPALSLAALLSEII